MKNSAAQCSELFPLSGYVPHGKLLKLVEWSSVFSVFSWSQRPPVLLSHIFLSVTPKCYWGQRGCNTKIILWHTRNLTLFLLVYSSSCACVLACPSPCPAGSAQCSCPKPPLAVIPLSLTRVCSAVTHRGTQGTPPEHPKCVFKVISVVKLAPSASSRSQQSEQLGVSARERSVRVKLQCRRFLWVLRAVLLADWAGAA